MVELRAIVDRLKTLKVVLPNLVREVIQESEQEIIDLNQVQLFSGENADGSDIEPEYTSLTKRIKRVKGQPFDRVTLRDTGSFYGKMKVKTAGEILEIDSTDPKRNKLVQKYGEEIFGLTDENKSDLSEFILKPRLEEKIKLTLAIQ